MDNKSVISRAAARIGYPNVRPKQEEAVSQFISGKDVFVSLPTGSGKSLCYCLLPGVFDELKKQVDKSIVIVVSPLIALMEDQVRSMTERGVKAIYVGSTDDNQLSAICEGKYRLIFMSPESLLGDVRWRDMLQSAVFQTNLVAVVIDEAHCVKKWGAKFQKEFSKLGEVRSLIPPTVNMMALTATATCLSRKDICRTLGMTNHVVVSVSPNRPNIKYSVCLKPGTVEETFITLVQEIEPLRLTMGRTIVFCRTYDSCSSIYLFMRSKLGKNLTEPIGAPDCARYRVVDMFTACTHPDVKKQILSHFSKSNSILRVVIATVAFGMGLDCPNVRRIIHWGLPEDIELYLHETGRAGRDGLGSTAVLYNVKSTYLHVEDSMKDYVSNSDLLCRRRLLLRDFDGIANNSSLCTTMCMCCDICQSMCECSKCKSIPG